MVDLLALTLLLDVRSGQPMAQAGEGQGVGHSLGRAAHSWFLDTVARLDPHRADALHQEHDLRPFALWPALDQNPPFLRITSMDPDLTAFLLDRWLPNLPLPIELSHLSCGCQAVAQHTGQHPWAGQTTYARLIQTATARGADVRRAAPSVRLTFATPTLFRSHNLDVPLPLPALIFDGLLQKWNRFAPVRLDDDLKGWVQEHVAISRHRLETRLLAFDGGGREGGGDRMAGFCGSCRLTFVEADPARRAMAHALAAFAFYAGVGRRTAMGMGQVKMGAGG